MGSVIDRPFFYEGWRKNWGKLQQPLVDRVNFLLDKFDASTVFDSRAKIAFAFGNIKHETNNSYLPVKEGYYLNLSNTSRVNALYNYYTKHNPGALKTIFPNGRNGKNYLGAGFIQLTHNYNYDIYGKKIGKPLLKNPDLASEPVTAFEVMEAFCDGKMDKYFNDTRVDFFNSRKIINGLDSAGEIAEYCKKFFEIIRFI